MENRDIATILNMIAEEKVRFIVNENENIYFQVSAKKLTKKQYEEEVERRKKEQEEVRHDGH